jgi:hypothetical protein
VKPSHFSHTLLLFLLRAFLATLGSAECRFKAGAEGDTAMQKLRIVTQAQGFGTARQRVLLERGTPPKPQRRTRSPRYGVPSCRGKSAGVA